MVHIVYHYKNLHVKVDYEKYLFGRVRENFTLIVQD